MNCVNTRHSAVRTTPRTTALRSSEQGGHGWLSGVDAELGEEALAQYPS